MSLEEYINTNYKTLKKLFNYSSYTDFELFCELCYNKLI